MTASRPGFASRLLYAFWDPLLELVSSGAGSTRLLRRVLTVGLIEAVAFASVVWLLPGFTITGAGALIGATVAVALLNAILRPALLSVTLTLTVLTLGLFSLVLNALTLMLAGRLIPGFEVAGIGSALLGAVVLSGLGFVLASIVQVSDDGSFFTAIARRAAVRKRAAVADSSDALLVVSIDGLGEEVVRFAVRTGAMPTLARWLREGSHQLRGWECDLPAQTSASQAGLLYGDNFDIPAFRWYEKDSQRWMVSNRAADAAEIARRRSSGDGLLAGGGACIATLMAGDAAQTPLVMSALGSRNAVRDGDFYSFFVHPYNFTRSLLLLVREIGRELLQARRQGARQVYPRIRRGLRFAFARAAVNVMMADLTTSMVIDQMYAGAPIIYANYLGYDEIAHHAGPERPESLQELGRIDDVLSVLEGIAAEAPRHYRIVVLSDHGQSQGPTFLQQFGLTLEDLVHSLLGPGSQLLRSVGTTEQWASVNAMATEVLNSTNPAFRRAVGRLLSGSVQDGVAEFGPDRAERETAVSPEEVVVCASGNLGLVYLGGNEQRYTLEAIDAIHPLLVAGLAAHPGIGFVLVRSAVRGAMVVGANGVRYLDDDVVEGTDPLEAFGPLAAQKLRRVDQFPHVGDLLVNSTLHPATDEVHAFEELVGSHGGLGGPQTRAFVLYPSDFESPGELVGAAAVHEALCRWRDAAPGAPPVDIALD